MYRGAGRFPIHFGSVSYPKIIHVLSCIMTYYECITRNTRIMKSVMYYDVLWCIMRNTCIGMYYDVLWHGAHDTRNTYVLRRITTYHGRGHMIHVLRCITMYYGSPTRYTRWAARDRAIQCIGVVSYVYRGCIWSVSCTVLCGRRMWADEGS